jgi:hypothetical protein
MAITQIRYHTQGRAYYQRERQAGKSHREALRAETTPRRRRLPPPRPRPATQRPCRPGRTLGGDPDIQRAQPNPDSRLFGHATSRTRHHQAYDPPPTHPLTREVPHRPGAGRAAAAGPPGPDAGGGWVAGGTGRRRLHQHSACRPGRTGGRRAGSGAT